MNLTQIKYFHAVCLHGSVSKAAEYLHISQPSLSNAIRDLESEYGLQLFHRHHRGMTLTSEGQLMLKMSQDILTKADQADTILRDMGNGKKILRLGVPPIIGSVILPTLCGDFLQQFPDITLKITEGGRKELLDRLSEDDLDMTFLAHNQPLGPDLAALTVAKWDIVCCVHKDDPIASYTSVSPTDLAEKKLVVFDDNTFITSELRKWFASERASPDILLQTAQLSSAFRIVSSKIAASFLLQPAVEKEPELVSVPLADPIRASICLVWRKEKHLLGSMKRLISFWEQNPIHYYAS